MTSIKHNTLAEQFADALNNDGQRWETKAGMQFADLLQYISPWGVSQQRVDNGDITRYVLADGSAIVEGPCCWDIEHSELAFWMACEDPNDEEIQRTTECVEQAGYSVEPAEINSDFQPILSEKQLLFRRNLDAAE